MQDDVIRMTVKIATAKNTAYTSPGLWLMDAFARTSYAYATRKCHLRATILMAHTWDVRATYVRPYLWHLRATYVPRRRSPNGKFAFI